LETRCDACLSWAKPARFRRVCPLLAQTGEGLRCSADSAEVRPFWGRALGFFGGATLAVYLMGAVAVFTFLRTVGYPVSIVHVTLPHLWHRVGQARGWFFMERSNQAFAQGKPTEGLLYLANAYDFDPQNYLAGISLAKNLQSAQPARSDQVFEKLMREHPDKGRATAQDWFRALLARGAFGRIATLARDELLIGNEHAGVWLRALLVATRQTNDETPLRELRDSAAPESRVWHPVIETELLVRRGRTAEAREMLRAPWPDNAPAFATFYRVETLVRLHEPMLAADLLHAHRGRLDDEAVATLLLDIYALSGSRLLQAQIDATLRPRVDAPRIKVVTAHLIRHPNREMFDQVWQRFMRQPLPLNGDTAGAWFSLLCAAGAVGDLDRLHELTVTLRNASKSPFVALSVAEAFFRGETADRRIVPLLPFLPLPIDVTYALIERYTPPPPAQPAGRA
jgi:hypothetical protein